MSRPFITLTSDFGSRDGYAAAMKGVILGINPEALLVDISHEIPAQDIPHAAFVLGTTCRYFPPQTIHVVVVDPGVGTARRPLLLITPGGTYFAPDNGLLTYILMEYGIAATPDGTGKKAAADFMKPVSAPVPRGCTAFTLNRGEYQLKPVSDTFHGRDVFAPAAAHLSKGVPPEALGEPVDQVVCLGIPQPIERQRVVQGRIIYVDRFGNLISNIGRSCVTEGSATVEIEDSRIQGLSRSYSGEGLVALIGSHGYLEVAIGRGSAAQRLGATVGTRLTVSYGDGLTRP